MTVLRSALRSKGTCGSYAESWARACFGISGLDAMSQEEDCNAAWETICDGRTLVVRDTVNRRFAATKCVIALGHILLGDDLVGKARTKVAPPPLSKAFPIILRAETAILNDNNGEMTAWESLRGHGWGQATRDTLADR